MRIQEDVALGKILIFNNSGNPIYIGSENFENKQDYNQKIVLEHENSIILNKMDLFIKMR